MKKIFFMAALCCCIFLLEAQENRSVKDTMSRGITLQECAPELMLYISEDLLKTKAVLLLFNVSLHPLGRYEFYDAGAMVRYLRIPIRMNRCTLLYIDTGLHYFHTMYQQLKKPVYFEPGKIYMVRLFSRTIWPLGGVSIIKKNEQGEKVEYAAVLLEYINNNKAIELLNNMKKKEVLVNE
jgi:hypothetical protein